MVTTILTFLLVMSITIATFILALALHVLIEYHKQNNEFPDWETFMTELRYWIN